MTQELERGDSGVRSFVSVQSGLCLSSHLRQFGGEKNSADRTLTTPMQKGEKLGCFGLTEPGFGSNPKQHAHAQALSESGGTSTFLNDERCGLHSGTIADAATHYLGQGGKRTQPDSRLSG